MRGPFSHFGWESQSRDAAGASNIDSHHPSVQIDDWTSAITRTNHGIMLDDRRKSCAAFAQRTSQTVHQFRLFQSAKPIPVAQDRSERQRFLFAQYGQL